jgi:KipI family sensor histidine kinase inhibitor
MNGDLRILPYGEHALLVELAADEVITLRDELVGTSGVAELIPAARTLLVTFDPRATTVTAVTAAIGTAHSAPTPTRSRGRLVTLPARYDGPDLEAVAAFAGCGSSEVIRRHAEPEYTVAFCGFAPGFAYLSGLDPTLRMPRLDRPRTRVPTGSIGVAGEFTAVYPRASPGGWRLLGRTFATLWDLEADPPTTLTPGTRVRFEPQ